MGVVGGAGRAVVTRVGGVVTTVATVAPTVIPPFPSEAVDKYTRLTFPVSSFIYKRVKNLLRERRRRESKDSALALALAAQKQQQQQLIIAQQLQQVTDPPLIARASYLWL